MDCDSSLFYCKPNGIKCSRGLLSHKTTEICDFFFEKILLMVSSLCSFTLISLCSMLCYIDSKQRTCTGCILCNKFVDFQQTRCMNKHAIAKTKHKKGHTPSPRRSCDERFINFYILKELLLSLYQIFNIPRIVFCFQRPNPQ